MHKKSFAVGVFWSFVAYFISSLNDCIGKAVGTNLGGGETLFFRFLFGAIVFLPIFLIKGKKAFATKNMKMHAIRGAMFTLGMIPWSYGLVDLPMPLMTAISFTTPLFVLVLAKIFLNEKVGLNRAFATLAGFAGILISSGFSFNGTNAFLILALLATALFASLDIMNKNLLNVDEGLVPMVFYSSVWGAIFTAPLLLMHFSVPSVSESGSLLLLGISSGSFLFCLLKAYDSYEVSALQPFRYFEFLFSCALSIAFFKQWPSQQVLLGIALIIPAVLYISCYEVRMKNKAA